MLCLPGQAATKSSDDTARLAEPLRLMPVWAYGFIHCQERFHSQNELLDTAEEYRERKLPMDADGAGLHVLGALRLECNALRRTAIIPTPRQW